MKKINCLVHCNTLQNNIAKIISEKSAKNKNPHYGRYRVKYKNIERLINGDLKIDYQVHKNARDNLKMISNTEKDNRGIKDIIDKLLQSSSETKAIPDARYALKIICRIYIHYKMRFLI